MTTEAIHFADLTDGALWNAFRGGSEDAFVEIRKRYLTILYRYGCKLCYNSVLAKESISDMFVDLWFTKANLGATSSVSNYLYASLRRRIYAELKKQNRFDPIDGSDENFAIDTDPDVEARMISTEKGTELEKIIRQVLDSLPGRQREVIHLRFFGEKTYEEIAQIMELNPQSAYNLIHRSLKSVRQRFEELGIDGSLLTLAAIAAWAASF